MDKAKVGNPNEKYIPSLSKLRNSPHPISHGNVEIRNVSIIIRAIKSEIKITVISVSYLYV
jgi:hypothetical protein